MNAERFSAIVGRYPRLRIGIVGDFFLDRTDLVLPGKGLDFRFRRTYHSRLDYAGPLGYAWDHAYNVRLVPTKSEKCTGELLFMGGLSRQVVFRQTGENATSISYTSDEPTRLVLSGKKSTTQGTTWTIQSPDGGAQPAVQLLGQRGERPLRRARIVEARQVPVAPDARDPVLADEQVPRR